MNILVVGRTLPSEKSGSYGLFEFQQASALSKKNNVGYFFVDNSSLRTNRKIKKFNKTANTIPTLGYYLPIGGLYHKIFDRIKAWLFIKGYKEFQKNYWKPDIIHIHFPLIVLNEKILNFLKSQGVTIVVTEHWSKVQKKEISLNKIQFLNKIYEASKVFICVSDILKKSIKELLSDKNAEIIVVPNMISEVFFQTYFQPKVEKNKVQFTYVGRLNRSKKVDLLISAFQSVFKFQNDVILNIIGDGPEKTKLEKQVNKKFKKRIIFHGNLAQKQIADKFKETTVFVSASSYETFGVPFIEALASGIPVIGADNLPIKKNINMGNGVLFKVNDKDDLSEKLLYMYNNFSKYNKNIIMKNTYNAFNENRIADVLLTLYSK